LEFPVIWREIVGNWSLNSPLCADAPRITTASMHRMASVYKT